MSEWMIPPPKQPFLSQLSQPSDPEPSKPQRKRGRRSAKSRKRTKHLEAVVEAARRYRDLKQTSRPESNEGTALLIADREAAWQDLCAALDDLAALDEEAKS